MGRDGRLGVGWPTEFGGRGFGQLEQTIFVNEAARRDIPLPYVTLQTVGPVLQRYGTQEQKDLFLAAHPRRRRPLRDRLHRTGRGHRPRQPAHDGCARRRRATSSTGRRSSPPVVTTPTTSGSRCAPIRMLRSTRASRSSSSTRPIRASRGRRRSPPTARTTSTPPTTHDVRVPVSMRVGDENQGWRLITTQLNHERVMLGPAGRLAGLYDRVHDWAREADGVPRRAGRAPRARRGARAVHAHQRTAQLAGRRERGRPSMSPTRRRRRCSRPSARSACSGCSRRSSVDTATRPIRQRRSCCTGSTSRPSAAWCSPSAAASTRCSANSSRSSVSDSRGCRDERPSPTSAERLKAAGECTPRDARDPVNQAMINNWTEALGDDESARTARGSRRRR